jgi:CrcB protein
VNVLLVVLGGVVGALARVVLDSKVNHRRQPTWPWATLLINVTGSLLLGVISGLSLAHGLSLHAKLLVGTGFCGAFTTFSAASFEVARLAQERRVSAALLCAAGGAAACLGSAALGLALTGGLT